MSSIINPSIHPSIILPSLSSLLYIVYIIIHPSIHSFQSIHPFFSSSVHPTAASLAVSLASAGVVALQVTQKKPEKTWSSKVEMFCFCWGYHTQKKGNYIYIYDTGIGFMVMMIFTYTLTIQQKFKNMWVNRYHSPYTWILWDVI